MLQIDEFTEATLATLTIRVEKHGDEDKAAVSLGLELMVANTLLDSIDEDIRPRLYKRHDGQEDLPGVEQSTPVLACNSINKVTLGTKYEGWTLEVDDGIDDTDPQTFKSVKLDKFSVEPKQGGSCVLRMRAGTSDLDAERSGFLGMHVGQSIWIKLRAPVKAQDGPDDEREVDPENPDDDGPLFPDLGDDEPALTAGDIFANAYDPEPSATVVTIKKRRGKLGTDAEQAAHQAAVLEQADKSMAH